MIMKRMMRDVSSNVGVPDLRLMGVWRCGPNKLICTRGSIKTEAGRILLLVLWRVKPAFSLHVLMLV